MTQNLDQRGLRSIINDYDLLYIDIWGVIHNGIKLNKNAIEVLDKISSLEKDFVLLTNAPRPNETVVNFLKKMGLQRHHDKIFTSGEAALRYLIKELNNKKFYHIGPPRDFDLFKSFENLKVNNINDSEYLLCSGLFENHEEDLNYYKNFLSDHIDKKMICTNPDLVVDRGEQREFCAGSIAKIFEEINGEVIYFGKPYPPVYDLSSETNGKRILCIGDNLNTDIRGANIQNFDSLLITDGIHRQELENINLNDLFIKYNVKVKFTQKNLKW
tara:strand:+ start:819 stop:1634 length:816 start_codon:yes stop_codon:yes gene_type:complete